MRAARCSRSAEQGIHRALSLPTACPGALMSKWVDALRIEDPGRTKGLVNRRRGRWTHILPRLPAFGSVALAGHLQSSPAAGPANPARLPPDTHQVGITGERHGRLVGPVPHEQVQRGRGARDGEIGIATLA